MKNKGSSGEVRAQAYVALDAHYLEENEFSKIISLASKCSSQIAKFIDYLDRVINENQVRETLEPYGKLDEL